MASAALTMVWNEGHYLPIWLRHYGNQVGEQNCFIIDHGSDDHSTQNVGRASLIRIPRSPLDEEKRAIFVSTIATGLLQYYETVFHSDVDELLVADPTIAASLNDFAAICDVAVATAVGLDIMHDVASEPPIDTTQPITQQRRSVRFVSPMCKPAMIRKPVRWQPGFHSSDHPIKFGPLFNFHLRRYDLETGLQRLAKTRAMPRAHPGLNAHQAIPDQQFRNDFIYGVDHKTRRDDVTLALTDEPLKSRIEKIEADQHGRSGEFYKLDLNFIEQQLWRIPERFVGLF